MAQCCLLSGRLKMVNGSGKVLLTGQSIIFRFPEIHEEASLKITFMRTLRVPDNGVSYPLPASVGNFPICSVEDYTDKLSEVMQKIGGVMFPMYQSEATWINFDASYPMAVKIGAGKINAVTGGGWVSDLCETPQDYVTVPDQRWLDGFCVKKGAVNQFVAMPLGQGYTAEEQITGKAEFGGLQIQVYPMTKSFYKDWQEREANRFSDNTDGIFYSRRVEEAQMGFAPGGSIEQEIYDDPHGIEAWDHAASARCFVHVVNSADFKSITGRNPPLPPITKKQYQSAGIPWFEVYSQEHRALNGSGLLAALKSVSKLSKDKQISLFDERTIYPGPIEAIKSESSE